MPLDQEQFERLEGYVDGELDPAARAEVETQLVANPQLRKLLNELVAARDLVRGLPRAKAPADLLESFQSQLERSELFGDTGTHEADVIARINRAPQYMAVAAVVFLALGMAAIIYKIMLPHSTPNNAYVAATNPAMESANTDEHKLPGHGVVEPKKFEAPLMAEVSAPMPTTRPVVTAAVPPPIGAVDDARDRVSGQEMRMMQQRLAATQPARDVAEPTVMVVRSQSPREANLQVRGFLVSNGIAYSEANGSPYASNNLQLQAIDQTLTSNTSSGGRREATAPGNNFASAAQNYAAQNISQQQSSSRVQALVNNAGSHNDAAATSQNFSQELPVVAQNNFANSQTATRNGTPGGYTYRARLTQRQIDSLNATLQTRGDQWTEVSGGFAADMAEPKPQHAIERRNAATQPIAFAKVAVTQPTTTASTQPTTNEASTVVPTPATQPIATATQPAATQTATTAPAEEPREVVIVVHSDPINTPATQPTSAPATTAP